MTSVVIGTFFLFYILIWIDVNRRQDVLLKSWADLQLRHRAILKKWKDLGEGKENKK